MQSQNINWAELSLNLINSKKTAAEFVVVIIFFPRTIQIYKCALLIKALTQEQYCINCASVTMINFYNWAWFLCLVSVLGPGDGQFAADGDIGDQEQGIPSRAMESLAAASWPIDMMGLERASSTNNRARAAKPKLTVKDDDVNNAGDILSVAKCTISVTNDGPVIIGSTATFVATVIVKSASRNLRFVWSGSPRYLPQNMFGHNSSTIAIPFEETLKPGKMNITLAVQEMEGFVWRLIGESNSSIEVTDTINGHISMRSRAYPQCNISTPSCSVPTKTNLTLEAELHDPSDFFEGAIFFYRWNMGNGVTVKSKQPYLTYNYTMRGEYNVTVHMIAIRIDGNRTGVWWRTVRVLDAITNLTISSRSSSVQVGNKEIVNVTCNGSPPVELCLTVNEPSTDWSNRTNTTCAMVLNEQCHSTLTYHFKSSGKYTFQAAATNNVSFAVSSSTIHAHAPPSLPPQSITAITIAVIAGLCMTSFAVISFIQQVRRNRERHIEVANFDFQFRDHSDSFSKLKTSFFGWKRGSGEERSLMNNSRSNFYSL